MSASADGSTGMRVTTRRYARIVVAAPAGEFSDHSTAGALEAALAPLLAPADGGNDGVLLDFEGVDYIARMISRNTDAIEFDALRPRLKALLELHRAAQTEEAREALVGLFEDAFLATAWHVAHDLLENGWEPSEGPTGARDRGHLRVVRGSDAA